MQPCISDKGSPWLSKCTQGAADLLADHFACLRMFRVIKAEPSVPCRMAQISRLARFPKWSQRGLETEVGGEGGLSLRGSLLLLSAWARNGTFSEEFRSCLGVQRVCGVFQNYHWGHKGLWVVSKQLLGVPGFVGCFKSINH